MRFFILIILSLIIFDTFAQRKVSGRVTSHRTGEPLAGATVHQLGTTRGVITDYNGNYQIEVGNWSALSFYFWGYEQQQITVRNDSVIDVVLVRERIGLPQFTVTTHFFGNSRRVMCELITTDRRGVSETHKSESVVMWGRTLLAFQSKVRRTIGIGKCRIRIGRSYRIRTPETGWTGWIRSHERNCVTSHYYDINGEKTDSPVSIVSQEKKWNHLFRQKFFRYIYENLNYPITAVEKGISCRVIVGFSLNFDGSITNIEIMRGCEPLSEEVLSVINSAPKWNGLRGRQADDFPIYFAFPILFRLERVTDLP